MKKAILLALCLVLAGMLAVDGTFAAEFTQAVTEAVSTLFKTVEDIFSPAPTQDPDTFQVSIVYPDSGPGLALLSPGHTTQRKVAIENQSNEKSAYFRIAFAVQADIRDHLSLNFNTVDYAWSNWREDITIGDQHFDLIIATYTQPLAAGQTSPAALLSVTLDADITSQQMNAFAEDFLQIQALAICADDFTNSSYQNAVAALDQALPIPDDFNPF